MRGHMRPMAPFMKPILSLIRQLGFLRLGAASARNDDEEEGRVLHLFRNRAELKKAHTSLQDETQRLKDRIKQQEGVTARVQEMLSGLEARLGQPESAYPAMVFYQLRELWTLGRTLLTQFVAELAAQQEDRERRQFLAEYNRRQFERRRGIEATLLSAETRAADAREAVAALERRITQLRQFWHYFKRRALKREQQAAQLQSLLCIQDLESARVVRDAFEAEPAPEFAGLSIEARRAINLAAVSYAQILCDRLARTKLLTLAREAAGRREPPREEYGDRARCETHMAEIQRGRVLLQQRTNLPQEIKECSERLREQAKYRGNTETIPSADAFAADTGTRVLADDCWEIYRVMLR